MRRNAGEDAGAREPSFTVGVVGNWCSNYGTKCGAFSKNQK